MNNKQIIFITILLIVIFIMAQYWSTFDAFIVQIFGSRKILFNLSVFTILTAIILSTFTSFSTLKKSNFYFVLSLILLIASIFLLLNWIN